MLDEGVPLIPNSGPKQAGREHSHFLRRKIAGEWGACFDEKVDCIIRRLNPRSPGRECLGADTCFKVSHDLP